MMDREILVLIADQEPGSEPPRRRHPLLTAGLVLAVAFGVWGIVANAPVESPTRESVTTLPHAFPTTTAYISPLREGGATVEFPGGGALVAIADGPAGLVAAGVVDSWSRYPSFLWQAQDGVTWTYVEEPNELLSRVLVSDLVGGEDGYVLTGWEPLPESGYLGGRPLIWASQDGVDWSPATGLPHTGGINHLGRGGQGFVALGWQGSVPEGYPLSRQSIFEVANAKLWFSREGTAWSKASFEGEGQPAWFDDVVEYSGGLLLGGSLNNTARLWTSEDGGRSWELVEDENAKWPIGLGFVSVAADGDGNPLALARRRDPDARAHLWSQVHGAWLRLEEGLPGAAEVAYSEPGGLIVASGPDAPAKVYTSATGRVWETLDELSSWDMAFSLSQIRGGVVITGMAGGQPRLWEWPARSTAVTSPLTPWVARASLRVGPDYQLFSWPDSGMVFIGSSAEWWVSSDGLRWDRAVFFGGDPPQWLGRGIRLESGGLVVVGNDLHEHPTIWSSADGARWDRVLDFESTLGSFDALYQSEDGLIATLAVDGNLTARARSSDGRSWFVIYESSDGMYLETIQTTAGLVRVQYGPGPLSLSFSSDGEDWVEAADLPPISQVLATTLGLLGISGDENGGLWLLSADLSSAEPVTFPFGLPQWMAALDEGLVVYVWDELGLTASVYYTGDLQSWVEMPTASPTFPGVNAQPIGGDPLLVVGWDRGKAVVWEYVP
jgi:hypothetical protein